MPGFAVDQHPEKERIIEGILAGRSVRDIARAVTPPVDFMAIQRYKTNVIKPMVRRAEYENRILNADLKSKPAPEPMSSDTVALQATKQAAMDAPTLSIFRQRLEKLHGVVDRSLEKAERAVRVIKDRDGNDVVAGSDLSPIAPLLAQGHKNLEILGRATGELEPQGGQGVSIQIIVPSVVQARAGQLPQITYKEIEGHAEEVAEKIADIGLIQGA